MTTQISFLGKGKSDKQTGYKPANYCFNNGPKRSNPFFGLSLMDCIKPQKLILLGTAGSMWDVFFDVLQTDDEAVLELSEAVDAEQVTQDMLAIHQERLSEKFGIPVQCVVIPYARSKDEQANILSTLADIVTEGERIVLDVTHGFRHLPMLALVAARYLTHVRDVHIENVYYGALEMTDKNTKETPVLELGGMLEMLDWVEALAIYQKSGNYGIFADLYEKDGIPADRAKMLAQAAYYERNNSPGKAKEKLSGAFGHIEKHQGPMGKIFNPTLLKNINWFRTGDRAEWEIALADRYLERKDYLRAIVFMLEGLVSRTVRSIPGRSMNSYDDRNSARHEATATYTEAKMLDRTRNALVHGVRSNDKEVQQLLQDEVKLMQTLRTWYKKLFIQPSKQQ